MFSTFDTLALCLDWQTAHMCWKIGVDAQHIINMGLGAENDNRIWREASLQHFFRDQPKHEQSSIGHSKA